MSESNPIFKVFRADAHDMAWDYVLQIGRLENLKGTSEVTELVNLLRRVANNIEKEYGEAAQQSVPRTCATCGDSGRGIPTLQEPDGSEEGCVECGARR